MDKRGTNILPGSRARCCWTIAHLSWTNCFQDPSPLLMQENKGRWQLIYICTQLHRREWEWVREREIWTRSFNHGGASGIPCASIASAHFILFHTHPHLPSKNSLSLIKKSQQQTMCIILPTLMAWSSFTRKESIFSSKRKGGEIKRGKKKRQKTKSQSNRFQN